MFMHNSHHTTKSFSEYSSLITKVMYNESIFSRRCYEQDDEACLCEMFYQDAWNVTHNILQRFNITTYCIIYSGKSTTLCTRGCCVLFVHLLECTHMPIYLHDHIITWVAVGWLWNVARRWFGLFRLAVGQWHAPISSHMYAYKHCIDTAVM